MRKKADWLTKTNPQFHFQSGGEMGQQCPTVIWEVPPMIENSFSGKNSCFSMRLSLRKYSVEMFLKVCLVGT